MKIIGYPTCNAGLNNQKIALLGLFLTAQELGASVAAPRITEFSPEKGNSVGTVEFDQIFSPDALDVYAEKTGSAVLYGQYEKNMHYGDMFARGNKATRAQKLEFLAHLRPCAGLEEQIETLVAAAFDAGPKAALQLRIERDWHVHVENKLQQVNGEDNTPDYRRILRMVAEYSPSPNVYVSCDESAIVPGREAVSGFAETLGLHLIWKSNFERVPGGPAWETELDFRVALAADTFFGTSRSTFSNILATTKSATSAGEWQHFLYNVAGAVPLRRTDDGLESSALAATRTTSPAEN